MPKDYKTFTVASYRQGTAARWLACFGAMHVVGNYDKGATQAIARELSISVSQVENLARAGVTRKALHKHGLKSDVVNRLTPSHFAVMGKMMRRYEFSPYDAIEDLRVAAEEGVSVESMAAAIRGMHGDGKGWLDWWDEIVKRAENLEAASDAPEWVQRVTRVILAAARERP